MNLVSVIIPFYNTPCRFFREAIESVLAQTNENWELLLVDDGSNSECTDMAKDYAANDPRKVHYFGHPGHRNLGSSASRNLGIHHARGDYIAFLDSDDVWQPQKLEAQMAILRSSPTAGMVYGKSLYWWGWTGNSEDKLRDRIQEHGIVSDRLVPPPKLLVLFLKGKALLPCPSSILIRRAVLEKTDGFEEEFDGLYDDQVFYAKVSLQTPVYVSNNCWDSYRQHPDSLCAEANEGQFSIARQKYFDWLTGYLIEHGFRNSDVWNALKYEKFFCRHWWAGRRIKRSQRFIGRLRGTYPKCTFKK